MRPSGLYRRHRLHWEQSRLSHHLARMQKRGRISREHCESDRRGAFVVLSAAGRQAIEQAAPAHADTVRQLVFDGLSATQVKTLRSVTSSVLERLSAPEPDGSARHDNPTPEGLAT